MTKKLTAALCCAVIATLAVAGCGSSQDKADAYAKKVCDQVHPQQKNIQQATSAIASVSSTGSPSDVQKTDSAAFGQMADAYRALGDAVKAAGPSPVDNGATLQKNAVRQLDDMAASYVRLKKTLDGLDTHDQGKFAQGLKSVSDQLSALSKNGGGALAALQAGDIGKAMAKQPGCAKPSASASSNAT